MVLLAFIVFCLVLSGWAHLTKGGPRQARTAEVPVDAGRVQDRWTALDDRQLTRLLADNAPC